MADPALDALPDGAVIAGADGRVTAINTVAARMFGTTRLEAEGRDLAEVVRLVDSSGCTWAAANTPYDGLATRTGVPEQSWLLPDGREVLVAARLHREVRLGPVTGVALSLRAGRGRARLDRERSDLVATVAHELRSPLSGVKGFVQALLLRWDRLDDEQRRLMLHTVQADADRVTRLISELLDVARLDTGRLVLQPRTSDLAALSRRVVDSVAATTARPIALDAPEGLPAAYADPDRFAQVLTNLVENAVKHGAGTVRVALAGHGRHVVITVADEGPGVPDELRRLVFTKFWTTSGGGSGLGLYVVHGLVQAHGGTVSIRDAEPAGALVDVRWPAADPG